MLALYQLSENLCSILVGMVDLKRGPVYVCSYRNDAPCGDEIDFQRFLDFLQRHVYNEKRSSFGLKVLM